MTATVTLLAAISDNVKVLQGFGESTLANTPPEYPKILVDNSPFPATAVQEILAYWVRAFSNVTVLHDRGDLLPFPEHARALDMAMEFVHTPLVATFDFDFFLTDSAFWQRVLDVRERTSAHIVGCPIGPFADYVHPFCALYDSALARAHGFAKRARPESWRRYIRSSDADPWRVHREATCDVGEALHIEALEAGYGIVHDFPCGQFGRHLGAAAPFGHVDYDANIYFPTRGRGRYWGI